MAITPFENIGGSGRSYYPFGFMVKARENCQALP